MRVQLLKDVSLPHNGGKDTAPTGPPVVGNAGEVVEMEEHHAKAYIKRKLAVQAGQDAPADAKQNKEAEARKAKPKPGPPENKVLTHETIKAETK